MTSWLRILMVGMALSVFAPIPAQAQDGLEAAKSAGQIGERPNGLVASVSGSAPPDIAALVERVNAQRLARYKEIARSNGTSLDKVQALAGQQLIERTPSGQFVMTREGAWVRK